MRKLYLLLAVLLSAVTLQAQSIGKGDFLLNAGLGVGTYDGQNVSFPPISLSGDYTLKDNLFDPYSSMTLGGYLGYYGTEAAANNLTWKWSNLLFGVRGALHYSFLDQLDTYGGLMLGYNKIISTVDGLGQNSTIADEASKGKVIYSVFVGARYFFTNNVGAYAEVGYGVSALELGITFRL